MVRGGEQLHNTPWERGSKDTYTNMYMYILLASGGLCVPRRLVADEFVIINMVHVDTDFCSGVET